MASTRKVVRFSNPLDLPSTGVASDIREPLAASTYSDIKGEKMINVPISKSDRKGMVNGIPPPPPPPPPPPRNTRPLKSLTNRVPPPPPPRPNSSIVKQKPQSSTTQQATETETLVQTNIQATCYASPSPKGSRGLSNQEPSLFPNGGFVDATPVAVLSPLSSVSNMNELYNVRGRIPVDSDTTLDTIDMINFDFIEQCNSLPDLHRIIRLLKDPNYNSPLLLRAAQKRLVLVHKRNGVPPPPPPPPAQQQKERPIEVEAQREAETGERNEHEFVDGAVNISRITAANTTLDSIDPSKSTLNFSLSPSSTLQGMTLVDTPTLAESLFFLPNGANRLGPIPESPSAEDKRSFSKKIVRETPPLPMSKKPKSMENVPDPTTMRQEESFKKVIADLKIQVDRATTENTEWKGKVEEINNDHDMTRRTLDLTRAAFCKKNQETRALEERLERKIAELSNALASTADRSRLVISAEKTLRTQCEGELSKQNKMNVILNKQLRETKDDLEQVKRRHMQFRLELMKAAGATKAQLRNLSQEEFVSYLSKKIKSMQEKNDSMSRTLDQAKHAVRKQEGLEIKIQDMARANQRLEAENAQLNETIRELRAEVKSSRAYIDKLLKTSNETNENDWEKQEGHYKIVIQNLRRQLRQQESTVSVDLYKSAIDDSRRKLSQLRIVESSVEKLKAQVSQLQQEKETMLKSTKTPKSAATTTTKRSVFFSPTSQLERNRLFVASQPPSAVRTAYDEYQSAVPTIPSVTPIQPTKNEQKVGDMTGVTISFENDISPQTSKGLFKRRSFSNRSKDSIPAILREVPSNRTPVKERPTTSKVLDQKKQKPRSANSASNEMTYHVPQFQKENAPVTPRSASKEVRERFGGAKALQNKLKKMRSPRLMKPSAAMPMREVQVIFH